MAKFNHNSPSGKIEPPENGAVHWQNGHAFDNDYNHIDLKTGKVIEHAAGQAPPLKTKGTKENALEKQARQQAQITPQQPQEGEQQEEKGDGEGEDPSDPQPGDVSEVSEGIDLVAWAKGTVGGVQWFKVKKALETAGYTGFEGAAAARELIAQKHGFTLT